MPKSWLGPLYLASINRFRPYELTDIRTIIEIEIWTRLWRGEMSISTKPKRQPLAVERGFRTPHQFSVGLS